MATLASRRAGRLANGTDVLGMGHGARSTGTMLAFDDGSAKPRRRPWVRRELPHGIPCVPHMGSLRGMVVRIRDTCTRAGSPGGAMSMGRDHVRTHGAPNAITAFRRATMA